MATEVTLSAKQALYLKQLADGLTRAEIAEENEVSIHTVKSVLTIIKYKLFAKTIQEALVIAIKRRLI